MTKQISYDVWKKKIMKHLSDYKLKMGILENGVSHGKMYSHVLPIQLGVKNYICDAAKSLVETVTKHTDWNHLNSSQAMCWNFFAPMLQNQYSLLNRFLNYLLNTSDIRIEDSQFEYSFCSEIGRKGTAFDFWCKDSLNRSYYFEIKFTENGIARKSKAKDPKDIYERVYKKLIKPGHYLEDYKENWELLMLQHYQMFRNLVMADESKGSYCFFITMRGNPSTYKELSQAFSAFGSSLAEIEKGISMRFVKSLYWEDIIPKVIAMCSDQDKEKYEEFKRKYLLYNEEF